MFPDLEFIKTCLNGIRTRFEIVEKALAHVKEQVLDIIQDIKNVRIENAETIKASTADWEQNDPNALDYVKNRTHYMIPTTHIGNLEFTATADDTIEYTTAGDEARTEILAYFTNLSEMGEVIRVSVNGKTGMLSVSHMRGYYSFSGVFSGYARWGSNEFCLVAQNDFMTFNPGDSYIVSFEDTTKPYYSKLDFHYMPDNVYHSENSPVKFGSGDGSTVQGSETEASGDYAHAEGYSTTASGYYAHAEGGRSIASGSQAHAEGYRTTASGSQAHAEGYSTTASGDYAHAEGNWTTASGDYAHAEGNSTTANRLCMRVDGEYNLYEKGTYIDVSELSSMTSSGLKGKYAAAEYTFDQKTGYYTLVDAEIKDSVVLNLYYADKFDYENNQIKHLYKPISSRSGTAYNIEKHNSIRTGSLRGRYIHVSGNGTSSKASNAYTLDWSGNGWFAGDVYVGGASQDDGVKLLKAGEAIPLPSSASVGQTIVVKAVDENGRPTEWEMASLQINLPSITSDDAGKVLAVNADGTGYELKEPSGFTVTDDGAGNVVIGV